MHLSLPLHSNNEVKFPLNLYKRTPDDIYYNAVGSFGEEQGNATGTGSGESMESKLEQLSIITSVEVHAKFEVILNVLLVSLTI